MIRINNLILLLICISFFCKCSTQTKEVITINKNGKSEIDSVLEKYFTYLDSVVANKINLNFEKYDEILNQMETLTQIQIEKPYYFWHYKMGILENDVKKWKTWCEENKNKLRWNEKKKTLEKIE